MKLSFVIFRIISGSVLLVFGFIAGNSYLPKNALFNIPYLAQTLVAFIAGAAGLYIIPYVIVNTFQTIVRWLTTLIQVSVQTTVARSMGSFFAREAGKMKARQRGTHVSEASMDVKNGKNKILLDTSAIIDGRIFDVAKAGFISGEFIVPIFVISELQGLADSGDDLKRQRGRRGLNLLDGAKKEKETPISVWDGEIAGSDVDGKLTRLAKKMRARVATVDYNLNKVASVSGVKILNVNDLANLIKTVILPGERLTVKVIQEGKDGRQGVGYLEDGTMIVVENGRELIGREIEVEVSRLLQSSAGKMIFAKIPSHGNS